MEHMLERHARAFPARVAYTVIPSNITCTWSELEHRSRMCAAALIQRGFEVGDVIAIYMENNAEYIEIVFAAQRAGLYFTPISRSLKPAELRHILNDSGAKAVFFSPLTAAAVAEAADSTITRIIIGDSANSGAHAYEDFLTEAGPKAQLPERPWGVDFCYSSGTTGLPKGIKRDLASGSALFETRSEGRLIYRDFGPDTVYLTPAPLYHSAPLRYTMRAMTSGGQAVIMERFDPQLALEAIERHRVTHSQ